MLTRERCASRREPILMFVALLLCAPACGPTANPTGYRMALPPTSTPPFIDGVVDPGWTSSAMFDMDSGASVSEALFRGTADNNNLYLYYELEAWAFNKHDALVIAFNPTKTTSGHHRIHVFPCYVQCSGSKDTVSPKTEYWTGTSSGSPPTSVAWAPQSSLNGLEVKLSHTIGSSSRWAIEVKIPISNFSIPKNAYFDFYTDLIKVDISGVPLADGSQPSTQYSWPPGRPIAGDPGADVDLQTGTPLPTQWGHVIIANNSLNGVYISMSDIKTNHGPATISLNQPNTFYATAHNDTTTSGTFTVAKNVRATFEIANNGLPPPASWAKIPGSNPTPYANIDPTGFRTYTLDWTLTPTERSTYAANPDQCVRVTLNSSDTATVFAQSSAMSNMKFVTTSSPFERVAQVGTVGYSLQKGRREQEFLLDEYLYNVDPKLEWTSEIKGAERTSARRYRLMVPQGQTADLGIRVDLGNLEVPNQRLLLPSGTGGKQPSLEVPVPPGGLITVIAEGTVHLRGDRPDLVAGPGGVAGDRLKTKRKAKAGSDEKRSSEAPAPEMLVGAVMGSWDGFQKSSFLIGPAATFRVPDGAGALYLAINDAPGGHDLQVGKGFDIQVIASKLEDYHLQASSILALGASATHVTMPLGASLPTWVMRGKRNTGKTLTIDGKRFTHYEPIGSFGYLVNERH